MVNYPYTLFVYVAGNIEKLLKSISKLAKANQVVRSCPTLPSPDGVFIHYENGKYSVKIVADKNTYMFSCSNLPAAAILCLKTHYVCNVHYLKEIKAFYGVLEAILGIPVTVSLGSLANKCLQMFKEK
jgi:hypothetical protein